MDKTLGVLYTVQMNPYLEQQLSTRYNLFKLYDVPIQNRTEFLKTHAQSIRAIVGNAQAGADAELIELLPKLEIVASFSVGLDKVDLEKCKEKGIRVTNTPDVLTDDVADLAIGLTLAVMRKICEADRYVRRGSWKLKGDFKLTSKFSGKTMGIVGLGRIGSAIAKRAKAFGCSICYHSRSEKPGTNYTYYANVVDLAANCDVLVVACSLNKDTHHIIDHKVLDALGTHGILVNIGRGAHIDEPELLSALLEGRLGGAGLDVFEHEPHVPEELFGLENVVIQSHVGSDTKETCQAMADLVLGNLEAHVLRRPLLTPVL